MIKRQVKASKAASDAVAGGGDDRFLLLLSCPNKIGIVFAVAGFLFERGLNILSSDQFDDEGENRFFMRVEFSGNRKETLGDWQQAFAAIAERFAMDWSMHSLNSLTKIGLLVSKQDHCLADVLYRYGSGELPVEISFVASNHRDAYQLAASYNIPFHHLPVTAETKAKQEQQLLDIIKESQVELIVLARYMQILSADILRKLPCPAINIHHSFLPSFKGAQPYHQAHKRGVKIIGATAHYVAADLDEGPIIEQDTARVDHSMSPMKMTAVGRDVEKLVLARALKLHVERRVLMNGDRTVVFA